MKVVYVAGPFRAKTPWGIEQNIREAETLALEVARIGAVPLCPHTMYRFYQESLPDEFWLEATLELLRRCDAIVLSPRWRESTGSKGEREEALRLGLPVFEGPMRDGDWDRFRDWLKS